MSSHTTFDLVEMLESFEKVKGSTIISEDQKYIIWGEMLLSLPPQQFFRGCPETYRIVAGIISKQLQKGQDAQAKAAPKKGSRKGANAPQKGNAQEEPLLLEPDEDTRRPRTKKTMVNKAP